MRTTAWSNGSPSRSGAGYGLRISRADRDHAFKRDWAGIIVDLPGQGPATIRLSDSFWRNCSELRSSSLGRWMMTIGLAPWPRGEPPVIELVHVSDNRFTLRP